jgi:hypothetical protein
MMKYFVLKSVVKNLGMHDNDINNGWLDYEKKIMKVKEPVF